MRRVSTIFDTGNEEHTTNPHIMLAEIIRLREQVVQLREQVYQLRELAYPLRDDGSWLRKVPTSKEEEE